MRRLSRGYPHYQQVLTTRTTTTTTAATTITIITTITTTSTTTTQHERRAVNLSNLRVGSAWLYLVSLAMRTCTVHSAGRAGPSFSTVRAFFFIVLLRSVPAFISVCCAVLCRAVPWTAFSRQNCASDAAAGAIPEMENFEEEELVNARLMVEQEAQEKEVRRSFFIQLFCVCVCVCASCRVVRDGCGRFSNFARLSLRFLCFFCFLTWTWIPLLVFELNGDWEGIFLPTFRNRFFSTLFSTIFSHFPISVHFSLIAYAYFIFFHFQPFALLADVPIFQFLAIFLMASFPPVSTLLFFLIFQLSPYQPFSIFYLARTAILHY